MAGHDVEDVDLLVVGGGKAGKSLAVDRAKAGWSVAMVERDKIGDEISVERVVAVRGRLAQACLDRGDSLGCDRAAVWGGRRMDGGDAAIAAQGSAPRTRGHGLG